MAGGDLLPARLRDLADRIVAASPVQVEDAGVVAKAADEIDQLRREAEKLRHEQREALAIDIEAGRV